MKEFQLTKDQQKASSVFTEFLMDKNAKYMVIQGDSGSGKSTLVNHLLKTMAARMKLYAILLGSQDKDSHEFAIELTATTNKAAGVLEAVTGKPCRTIHSCLGLSPKQNFDTGEIDFIRGNKGNIIYNSLLIIDEASYISDQLFKDIDDMTVNCKVVLVGDQYQLVPVKQEVPVMHTLDCYRTHLTEVMRHGGNIANAGAKFKEAVKTGVFSNLVVDGVDIVHADGPTFQAMIEEEFTHPDYNENKARVLAWANETVNKYNTWIRQIRGCTPLYEIGDVLSTNRPITYNKQTVAHTDDNVSITRIIRNESYYDVPGRIVTINNGYDFFLPNDPIEAGKFIKSVKQKKEWPKFFGLQEYWLDLRPSFASTIHKAQGSGYETVYINLTDISKCRVPSDVARMLYVAITRSMKKVVLYGQLHPMYQG